MSGSGTVYYLITAATNEVMQYGNTTLALWPSFEQASGAQQINSVQYALLLAGGRYLYLNAQLTPIPSSTFPLVEAQTAASTSIDLDAEQARLQFITPGFGMQLAYIEKQREGAAFMAAYPTAAALAAASVQPTSTEYPMLFAEIGITAPNAYGVATVYMQEYQLWQIAGAAIEKIRLTSKAAIAAATTMNAIAAAMNVTWPVPTDFIPVTGVLNQTVGAS